MPLLIEIRLLFRNKKGTRLLAYSHGRFEMSDVEHWHVNDNGGGDDPTVTVVDLSVCPDEVELSVHMLTSCVAIPGN